MEWFSETLSANTVLDIRNNSCKNQIYQVNCTYESSKYVFDITADEFSV